MTRSMPWLSYYGNTPASLDYPKKTMYQLVRETALAHPESVA